MQTRVAGVMAAACMVVAGCTSAEPPASDPGPLEQTREVAIDGPTGLRILAGDTVIDIDTGHRRRIGGLPALPEEPEAGRSALGLRAGDRIVLQVDCHECDPPNEVYVLSDDLTKATLIATRAHAAPSPDGLWAMAFRDECTLAKIGLDGATLVEPQSIDCAVLPREQTAAGLLAWYEDNGSGWNVLLDPDDFSEIMRADHIYAVAGDQLLRSDDGEFVLVDTGDGSERRLEFPRTTAEAAGTAPVSPDRRYIAIPFGTLASADVWVLDLDSLEVTQVPTMPLPTRLKALSVQWAPDGRLVLLGNFDTTDDRTLGLWRPGEPALATRPVDYPVGLILD